ncbi:unnamed protein product [Soboliphyme baturini]|uniref:ANK_REP_REGION domain-containing protein n=1 Tax=Soboliphyme baturini TaxID=241478 RepID=A0A183IGX0_9BILA|nr:unnamed protein product [Soboliphyme baturini]
MSAVTVDDRIIPGQETEEVTPSWLEDTKVTPETEEATNNLRSASKGDQIMKVSGKKSTQETILNLPNSQEQRIHKKKMPLGRKVSSKKLAEADTQTVKIDQPPAKALDIKFSDSRMSPISETSTAKEFNAEDGNSSVQPLAVHEKETSTGLLAEHGIVENSGTNKNGCIALILASEAENVQLCKELLTVNGKAQVRRKRKDNGNTAMHIACLKGNVELLRVISEYEPLVDEQNDGSTMMHIASLFGHDQTAMVFLKRGVPLQMPNRNGLQALHCAAMHGHLTVVKALLKKGCPIDFKTKVGAILFRHIIMYH